MSAQNRHGRNRHGLGRAFRSPEFRVLWGAEVVSVAGDQLARVALTVLVYGRTGSPLWAATTYALTFLPALLGGVLLGGLADRFPRRGVMVGADAARAVLVALMALPGLPLWVLCALLVVVVLLGPPHTAAQGALLPEVLPGAAFEAGLAVRQITNQAAQVAGFAAGGLLVALLSPPAALALPAATFAVSALVLRLGLADRPAPAHAEHGGREAGAAGDGPPAAGAVATGARSWLADARAGLVTVLTDPHRRTYALLAWLVGCYVVPEALAAPYAAQLGQGPLAVGVLMAADPAGSVVGAWLFTRFVGPAARERMVGPLAVMAGLPLALCALAPGIVPSVLLWGVAGACATACLVQSQAAFVRSTPDALRGRAIGVAASGLVAAQGVAVLLGGLGAEAWDARAAVALCGAIGAAAALALWATHRRLGTGPAPVPLAAGTPPAA
ncbi:MAG TPA: MFS transporter [Pseudonocardia sp.]|nr:MFS transporter [Pseudonocardia sp.]